MTTPYDNLDALYALLKRISTVEEFFEKKEPCHDDAFMKEVALFDIASGIPEEHVLSGLKSNERRRYAETQQERHSPH
jgi:hypothetical protein